MCSAHSGQGHRPATVSQPAPMPLWQQPSDMLLLLPTCKCSRPPLTPMAVVAVKLAALALLD